METLSLLPYPHNPLPHSYSYTCIKCRMMMVRPSSTISVAALGCYLLFLALPMTRGFVVRPLAQPQLQQQQASRSSSSMLKAAQESESSSSSSSALSRQGFLGGLLWSATGMLAVTSALPQATLARPEGVNRPELLPKEETNVIDLERFLTSGQKKRINQQLATLEKDTGIKVRLLCQRYPDTPGLAIKDFWKLDDKSIVVVADKGPPNIKQVATRNLINFNVGSGLQLLLPPAFWNRLRSKYGSIFYLREHGDDEAIIATMDTIETCIRLKGCVDVPKAAESDESSIFSLFKSGAGN